MPDPGPSSGWRLVVDPEKCQGHNRCHALAPDLFKVDEHGFASAAAASVPAAAMEKARLAVRNCPEYAISLVRADAGATGTEGEKA